MNRIVNVSARLKATCSEEIRLSSFCYRSPWHRPQFTVEPRYVCTKTFIIHQFPTVSKSSVWSVSLHKRQAPPRLILTESSGGVRTVFLTLVWPQTGVEGRGGDGKLVSLRHPCLSLPASAEFSLFAVHLIQGLTNFHESTGTEHPCGC